MSSTWVKTEYCEQGTWGVTERHTLYCRHNHSCDITFFYNSRGQTMDMVFSQDPIGERRLWEAMNLLYSPFKDEWGEEYKDGVEYWDGTFPDEVKP